MSTLTAVPNPSQKKSSTPPAKSSLSTPLSTINNTGGVKSGNTSSIYGGSAAPSVYGSSGNVAIPPPPPLTPGNYSYNDSATEINTILSPDMVSTSTKPTTKSARYNNVYAPDVPYNMSFSVFQPGAKTYYIINFDGGSGPEISMQMPVTISAANSSFGEISYASQYVSLGVPKSLVNSIYKQAEASPTLMGMTVLRGRLENYMYWLPCSMINTSSANSQREYANVYMITPSTGPGGSGGSKVVLTADVVEEFLQSNGASGQAVMKFKFAVVPNSNSVELTCGMISMAVSDTSDLNVTTISYYRGHPQLRTTRDLVATTGLRAAIGRYLKDVV